MGITVYPERAGNDFWLDVAAGNIAGYSAVRKFGRNSAVGTSFTPVAVGAIYQTLQVSGATALRVKAGNTNDTAAGSGAQELTLIGLDETGAEVTEAVATAGTSASAATSATFIRLYRAYVSASGTYATSAVGSHNSDIVVENGGGGTDWLTIDSTNFPRGQSEVGVYSIPLGKTGFIKSIHISVDSKKTADVMLFKRESILATAAPYEAMRIQLQFGAVAGEAALDPSTPLGPYPALTDIGFMARADVAAEVDVDFEIILVDS